MSRAYLRAALISRGVTQFGASLVAYALFGLGYIAYMTFVIAWMRDGGAGTGALIALAQRDVVYESGKDTRK